MQNSVNISITCTCCNVGGACRQQIGPDRTCRRISNRLLCTPGCVVVFFGLSGLSGGGGVTYWQQCSWVFVPHAVVAVGRAASLVFCLRSLLALCPQCVPPEGPDDNDNDRVVPRCQNGFPRCSRHKKMATQRCSRGAKMGSQNVKKEAPSPPNGNPEKPKEAGGRGRSP